eukprot:1158372-Pelagomonas_calceolata.AAC.7
MKLLWGGPFLGPPCQGGACRLDCLRVCKMQSVGPVGSRAATGKAPGYLRAPSSANLVLTAAVCGQTQKTSWWRVCPYLRYMVLSLDFDEEAHCNVLRGVHIDAQVCTSLAMDWMARLWKSLLYQLHERFADL